MLHDTTPLKFQPGILIFYVLGFVLYIVVFTFTYSFYRNAQMKVYNKLHYRLLTYFLFVLVLFLLLLGASIITFWHYANDSNLFINNFYMLPMS